MVNFKYSIGEFSKKTGITVRTLHYYDEINLLKPALTSSTGRRYYSNENIIQLQKIVSLKFLGYSLEKINEFIHLKDWDIKDSLSYQKQEMLQKQKHIESVIRTLDHALLIMEDQGTIDSSVFISLIHNIQMENEQKEWLKEYIPKDTIEELYNISEEKQQELNIKAASIYTQLKQANGQDPESENVQRLIQDLMDLAEEVYEDIIPFIQELGEKGIEMEDNPSLFPSPFSKEEEAWVSEAMEFFLLKKGVNLNGHE